MISVTCNDYLAAAPKSYTVTQALVTIVLQRVDWLSYWNEV